MGKTSYPEFSNGSISVNGQNKAYTTKNGNTVNTNYNMSAAEKQIYDYAQNSFLTSLPQVNVFDADTKRNLQNQVDAYANKGMKFIEDTYTPILNNLKNDIGSRFGSFDNSIFMDNLNTIEDKRADSISTFAQDVLARQNELYNDELSRRYNYLTFLSGVEDGIYADAMNYISAALQNSSAGNSYNAAAYRANASSNNNNFANMSNLIFNTAKEAIPLAIKLGAKLL